MRGLLGSFQVPIEVIANGANIDLFKPELTRPAELDLPPTYAVFFGGLTRWHGVECMLDAVSRPEWPDNVSLVIAGKGVESAAIADAASRNSRILVLGLVPYPILGAVVANALVGLVPISDPNGRSQTGLAPLKLFETLSCATPAIVTELKGQAEFVRDHNCGLVISDGDGLALARAVAQLNDNPQCAAQMGHRGAVVVRAEHSWRQRAIQTHNFIIKVIRPEVASR